MNNSDQNSETQFDRTLDPQPDPNRPITHQSASEPTSSDREKSKDSPHPIVRDLGVVGGTIAGATIGKSLRGNVGAVVGGMAGALAGGLAANATADFTAELIRETQPSLSLGLGADNRPIELPQHYTWEELKTLSKPQTSS